MTAANAAPGRPRRPVERPEGKGRAGGPSGAGTPPAASRGPSREPEGPPAVDPFDPATRRRWVEENCRRNGDPTPREIATRCLAIRAAWSADEERRRRGIRLVRVGATDAPSWIPERSPLAAGMPGSVRRRNGKLMARG